MLSKAGMSTSNCASDNDGLLISPRMHGTLEVTISDKT